MRATSVPGRPAADADTRSACVFAPSPMLTVTVEDAADGGSEVHLHAGGQGFWIARMLVALDLDTELCAPLGGEVGLVLEPLIAAEGVRVRPGARTSGNGAYVHDRRGGERDVVADMPPARLSRHEIDELYSAAFASGLAADVTVLGGSAAPGVVPADVFRRIAADLGSVGKPVVADLSGEELAAAVRGGLTVLKVSHDDLVEDGLASTAEPKALVDTMHDLAAAGARTVVVSRAGDPTFVLLDGELLEVEAPTMQRVDHRGAGDSMTAGIAAALAHGRQVTEALRLGAAAGASNVTRRGLATGRREVVEQLAEHILVRPLDLTRS
jgi:1-phosphofructokinase